MKTSALASGLAWLIAWGALAAAPPGTHDSPARQAVRPKPAGPIGIHVRLNAEPALGVPVTVTVTARAQSTQGLTLEMRADDPETLAIGVTSPPVDRDGARSWSVAVVPARSEGGYLNVVVAGPVDGVMQARAVVVAIRLPGAAPQARAPAAGPAGIGRENLSLLPVEERF